MLLNRFKHSVHDKVQVDKKIKETLEKVFLFNYCNGKSAS